MKPLYAAPLMSGDSGTEQTIDKIRQLVDDAWKDSSVRRFAFGIVYAAGVQPYDRIGQAVAIYDWTRAATYFLDDPVQKEALMPVCEMLLMYAQLGAIPGDCDDINAVLLPALLGSIGLETRVVTIASDARDPNLFSHIYAEVEIDGNWIAVDAARPGAQFGKAPSRFYRREEWSLVDSSHHEYSGMGRVVPWNRGSQRSALAGYTDSADAAQNGNSIVGAALGNTIGPTAARIGSCDSNSVLGCDVNLAAVGWVLLGAGLLAIFGGRLK